MFTENIEPIIYNLVATIGGKDTIQKGIVTVIWFWTDERSLHPKEWNNVFNFQN